MLRGTASVNSSPNPSMLPLVVRDVLKSKDVLLPMKKLGYPTDVFDSGLWLPMSICFDDSMGCLAVFIQYPTPWLIPDGKRLA